MFSFFFFLSPPAQWVKFPLIKAWLHQSYISQLIKSIIDLYHFRASFMQKNLSEVFVNQTELKRQTCLILIMTEEHLILRELISSNGFLMTLRELVDTYFTGKPLHPLLRVAVLFLTATFRQTLLRLDIHFRNFS